MLRISNCMRHLTLLRGVRAGGLQRVQQSSTSSTPENDMCGAGQKSKDAHGSLPTPSESTFPRTREGMAEEASSSSFSPARLASRHIWRSECRDRLILSGLCFHGFHGVFEEERRLGQKFMVDVDAWMDLRNAGLSDRLEDSVSYADVYSLVKSVVEGKAHTLLESVAHSIACRIFEKHGPIEEVRVRLCKPHVAVSGVVDALGVEIWRRRDDCT